MSEEWLLHPTPQEVIEKYLYGKSLDSKDLLHLKTRTFLYPIADLELLRGSKESNKREIVQAMYNILRWADEAEDGRFPINEKIWVLGKQRYVIGEIARRDSTASIDDLIKDPVTDITKKMLLGAVEKDTQIFIEEFGKGVVLKDIQNFPKAMREILRDCTNTMTAGMERALEKRELKTINQLEEYCDYVAGIIGEVLTDIVAHELFDNYRGLSREKGKLLGRGLQLTNIVKNVYEDAQARSDYPDARTFFIPRELFPSLTPQQLIYGSNKMAREARANVFEAMSSLAKQNLVCSIEYIQAIPNELSGFKGFVLEPFVAAVQTWDVMLKAGPEEVFKGTPEAVKMTREQFRNTLAFSRGIIASGRANEWLEDFKSNPKRYSFENGDKKRNFNNWVGDYIPQLISQK